MNYLLRQRDGFDGSYETVGVAGDLEEAKGMAAGWLGFLLTESSVAFDPGRREAKIFWDIYQGLADGEVEVALALWNVYNVKRGGHYLGVVREDGVKPLDLGGTYLPTEKVSAKVERMPAKHQVGVDKLSEVGVQRYGVPEVTVAVVEGDSLEVGATI